MTSHNHRYLSPKLDPSQRTTIKTQVKKEIYLTLKNQVQSSFLLTPSLVQVLVHWNVMDVPGLSTLQVPEINTETF